MTILCEPRWPGVGRVFRAVEAASAGYGPGYTLLVRIIVAFFPRGLTREASGLPSFTYSRVKVRSDRRILAGHAYGASRVMLSVKRALAVVYGGSSGSSWRSRLLDRDSLLRVPRTRRRSKAAAKDWKHTPRSVRCLGSDGFPKRLF
jgi:hypothetical protein